MGFRQLLLKLPTDYTEEQLRAMIAAELHLRHFSATIDAKSLDARKKQNIHWQVRVGVTSDELDGETRPAPAELHVPRIRCRQKALVIGSGPAGLFGALVLLQAGFDTTIIERGEQVDRRAAAIKRFEHGGDFSPVANYAFGEGGAGTFSDGKLTARTKNIGPEKRYILNRYIEAGAPEEIAYLAHPHLGTDNLRHIVVQLRKRFIGLGGQIHFGTELIDLHAHAGKVEAAVTSGQTISADAVMIAPGHSAYETYRMLLSRGVRFRVKNFALGSRIEHPQELINLAQWGKKQLPGVKAAEYRLTANNPDLLPVFTFCMCPGGVVVPATAYHDANIVNGMSRYRRNGRFANAACVAGIHLEELLGRPVEPLEALDWLEQLEHSFYSYTKSHRAPFATIQGFISRKLPPAIPQSSYPLGLEPAPLWDMLPARVSQSIAHGLTHFSTKLRGFDEGIILGLESKTSAPLQALRDERRRCLGWDNLYMAGEGSGWSGGIISSGVDGIRTALAMIVNSGETQ